MERAEYIIIFILRVKYNRMYNYTYPKVRMAATWSGGGLERARAEIR